MSQSREPNVADVNCMLCADLPVFLVEAYRLLLGRPIDPEGFRNYYERSLAGMTRLEILAELRSSTEGQGRGGANEEFIALLSHAPSYLSGSATEERAAGRTAGLRTGEAAADVKELLSCRDASFVDCAFQTLLKREPRPMEFVRSLQLLRDGSSPMRIICGIALLKGGLGATMRLPGAALALVRYLLARVWIVGAVFRELTGTEAETPLARRLRRTESLLLRMTEERRREWQELQHAALNAGAHGD